MDRVEREADPGAIALAATPKVCPSCRTRYPADALFCAFDGSPLATSPAAMAAAAASDPYIGHEIVGPIEIRQLVGLGAMGRVYRGFQKGIDRDVAVKILHRELSANPNVVARFHREAKVASRLAHPNVVHVLLTGQLPDGAMYIVMEYLDGMSLQGALAASGGAMPLPRALHIAMQLCDAVGEAHAQGIVHRDLKPENVMLVKRADDPDFVKVLDFGIARLNWGEQSIATAAGLIFGTARYISPEGAQGEKVAPPGDVYSIAMMFYQMLSGRTAFEADQAVALLVQQIHDAPPPLQSVARAAYVPDPIAAAVMRNLAKRPADRAENARELGRALLEAAVASGLSAHDILARPGLSAGRGAHASAVQMPSMQRTQQLHASASAVERVSASSPGGVSRTVFDVEPASERRTPARTEIAEPGATSPAGAATARWSASDDGVDPGHRTPLPSGVDATMDEQQQPPSRAERAPMRSSGAERAPLGSSGADRPRAGASGVSASSPGSEVTERPTRPRGLGFALGPAIVVGCFLLGVGGMVVAFKAGWIGARRASPPSIDAIVARANDALLHQRWDSPGGDNVRDLTDDGLARWPEDARLLRIRALACSDLLKQARAERDEGAFAEARHWAELAYRLDPTDGAAQKLAASLESAEPPPADSVPPLASASGAASVAASPAASAARVTATLEATTVRPAVGRPVDFAARVVGPGGSRPKVEAAAFRVVGPGLPAGTRLEPVEAAPGIFRATFTFLEPGRFEVVFSGRIESAIVGAERVVQVTGGAAAAPAGPKAAAPAAGSPASTPDLAPSAKWM